MSANNLRIVIALDQDGIRRNLIVSDELPSVGERYCNAHPHRDICFVRHSFFPTGIDPYIDTYGYRKCKIIHVL